MLGNQLTYWMIGHFGAVKTPSCSKRWGYCFDSCKL